MLADPKELDVTTDLSRPPVGDVERWVRLVVVVAVIATLAILVVGPRVAWSRDADTIGLPRFWFDNALAFAFVTTIVFACVPGARTSRFVRLAVVLPIVQVVLMIVAWIAWQMLRAQMPSADEATPLFQKLPVHVVLPQLVFTTALAGWIVARRKKREWLHATLMVALVNMLLLGLWLPIAAAKWNGEGWDSWRALDHAFDHPRTMIAYIIVPPLLGAMVFTATALRAPAVWRRNTGVVAVMLLLALVVASGVRSDVSEAGAAVYVNFMHVLASAGIVAVGALAALGVASWVTHARGRHLLDRTSTIIGTISSGPKNMIGYLEQTSWLRGPRPTSFAFTVWTATGDVPVPAGAHIVTPPPRATTLLHRGEAVPLLKVGDRVALAGFLRRNGDGPFRDTSAPIAGTDGITVGRIVEDRYGLTHVGLELWRPSIAYLLICVAVAVPGLAALLSHRF